MKTTITMPSVFIKYAFVITLLFSPLLSFAQFIMESKGENINVYGSETIKVYGSLKNSPGENGEIPKLWFVDKGGRLILTENIWNNTSEPLFLEGDSSHVVFQSVEEPVQYIWGDSIIFFQMTVEHDSAHHNISLENDIELRDTLTMVKGGINLNGYRLTLRPGESDNFSLFDRQPYIVGEDYNSYIWDTIGGSILLDICVPLGQISDTLYNFGGLGIGIQDPANLLNGGIIELDRYHYNVDYLDTIAFGAGEIYPIRRSYDIFGEDEEELPEGLNFSFKYLDHELNGINYIEEENLLLFRTIDGGDNWENFKRDTFSVFNQFVNKNDIDEPDGIWTLAPCPDPPVVNFGFDFDVEICALDTFWLDVGLTDVEVTWWDGSTENPYAWVPPNNMYTIREDIWAEVVDDRGCYTKETSSIIVNPQPVPDLGMDQTLCACPSTLCLFVLSPDTLDWDFNYLWQDGSTEHDLISSHPPEGLSTYSVTVTYEGTDLSCVESDSVDVTVLPFLFLNLSSAPSFSCNGEPILLESGGHPDADYTWYRDGVVIPGADEPDYLATEVGNYLYEVFADFDGLCGHATGKFINISDIELNTMHTDILCNGATTGTISVVPTGGYNGYVYFLNGQLEEDGTFTDLPAGSYEVRVTDQFCERIETIEIMEPPAFSHTITGINIDCNNLVGQIDFEPSGGTPPYTYEWSNDATTQDLSNLLEGGIYTVTLTDDNGCTFETEYEIEEIDPLEAALEITEVTCAGESTGQINTDIITGSAPYTYAWNNGETTDFITDLSAAFYEVTITDNNDCTTVESFDLQDPPALMANYDQQNISCNGNEDGSLTALDLGGTGSLVFEWDNGSSSESIDNLSAGDYSVTITDDNNCTTSALFTITEPTLLQSEIIGTDINCNFPGVIDLTPSGGESPYTFLWSNDETTEDLVVTTADNYFVTITDNNACTIVTNIEILNNADLAVSETALENVSCFGATDGGVTVEAEGGSSPYTYDIGNGPTADPMFNGLSAGDYTVTVTDANDCMGTIEVTISEPAEITIAVTIDDADCGQENGSAMATAVGGTGTLTYFWPDLNSTDPNVSDLAAGSYTLIVTDELSCTASTEVSIADTDGPQLEDNPTISQVSCHSGMDGAITVSASGGNGLLTFLWDNGVEGPVNNNLTAGDYVVSVTDDNGCQDIQSYSISQPEPLAVEFISQSAGCATLGALTAMVSGGTVDYSYLWSNDIETAVNNNLEANVYSLTITDAAGCTLVGEAEVGSTADLVVEENNLQGTTCNGGTNGSVEVLASGGNLPYSFDIGNGAVADPVFTDLAAGDYTITISDADNCSNTLTVSIPEPDEIIIDIQQTDAACGIANGTISAMASGGTAPLGYFWPTLNSTEPNVTNLAADNYLLVVTDALGCTNTIEVTIGNLDGPMIDPDPIVQEVNCFGENNGSISVTATGGAGTLIFNWSNGITGESNPDLIAGSYTVTVTDANDCEDIATYTISEPAILTLDFTTQNIGCATAGAATAIVTGGESPYTYLWSNGVETADNNNLTIPDDYEVLVTDAKGCTISATTTVTGNGTIAVAETDHVDVLCNGEATGSFTVMATGGTGTYTYDIGNGAVADPNFTNLLAGSYQVTITDSDQCEGLLDIEITEFPAIEILFATDPADCGQNNGTATATASGGNGTLSYFWPALSSTSPVVNDLLAGSYEVVVTDLSGCTNTATANISNNDGPVQEPNPSISPVTCVDGQDGAITVQVNGGVGVLTYLWSFNDLDVPAIDNLPAGDYTLSVTDASGCQDVETYTVGEPEPVVANFMTTPANCNSLGTAMIEVSGGNPPFAFSWPNGSTTDTATDLAAGNYLVTITYNNTCSVTADVNISSISDLALEATDNIAVTCNGDQTGSFTVVVSGGTLPYTYDIGNGPVNNPVFSNLSAGTYTVSVDDSGGCNNTLTVEVEEAPLIDNTVINTPSDCGQDNGTVTASAVGGTGALSFFWPELNSSDPVQSNLAPGVYNLVVTDAVGCSESTAVQIIDNAGPVLEPDPIISAINCNGDENGSIEVSATGGSGALSFSWNTGESGSSINNLGSGIYTITVSDVNGCQDIESITLDEPPVLAMDISGVAAGCTSLGQATAIASGGTGVDYNYLWSNGAITPEINDLGEGTYFLTVTDELGCSITDNIVITTTGDLLISESSHNDLECNGLSNGSFSITATGGTVPYSYDIGNGFSNNSTFSNLTAGSYTVTITDAANCISTFSTDITEPDNIVITTSFTPADCGLSTGSALASAEGGTGLLTYFWPGLNVTIDQVSDLMAGSYEVNVTDENGCSQTAIVEIPDSSGPAIDADPIMLTNVSCNSLTDGAITISAIGGTGTLTYNWDNGAVGESIDGLSGGTYVVTVSDANGCQDVATYVVAEPEALLVGISSQNLDCNNTTGTITATPSGGEYPYSYDIGNGPVPDSIFTDLLEGNYEVTVTDNNNCTVSMSANILDEGGTLDVSDEVSPVTCFGGTDGTIELTITNTGTPPLVVWDNGQIGETISNLPAGTYIASISNGSCVQMHTVEVLEPTSILIEGIVSNVNCGSSNDGAIDITVTGGTPTYSYDWENGSSTMEDLNDLVPGEYQLLVTDNNMCTAESTFTVGGSSAFNVNATGTDLSCFEANDGTASVNIFGGLPPYLITWSTGATTADISNLASDSYQVTVTDAANCIEVSDIEITEPAAIDFAFTSSNLLCNGDEDGSISIQSSGGPQVNHSYSWSTGQVGTTITNLPAGDYTVTINSGTCMQEEMETLTEPEAIMVFYEAEDVNCFGEENGSVDVTNVIGGAGAYSYLWNNNAVTEDINNLTAGTYTLVVTDDNACTVEQMVIVDEPDVLMVSDEQQLAGCQGPEDGWIDLTVSGGSPTYQFTWSNGLESEDINNLSGGIYQVTVSDQQNCTTTRTIELAEAPEPFEAYFLAATPVNAEDTIYFKDVSYPIPNLWNWSFDDPDNTTATTANPEFFFPQDINNEISYYNVQLIAANEFCRDTIVKTITVYNFRSNLPDPDTTYIVGTFFERFEVYPNPSNGKVMLDIKLKQAGDVELMLSNVDGKHLRDFELVGEEEYFQQLDLGQLAGGLYILTAKHEEDVRSLKLIVMDPD